MGVTFSQFFPPDPALTEQNLPSQKGKVFIVTGGYSGIGYELCRILYQAGGRVYLAGRSEAKANLAISRIRALPTVSPGEIVYLSVSLDDLTTIKPAVAAFASAETRLDALFNNAGVSNPPLGSLSTQGHELQLATNCLGPYLLTQLLLPILQRTAATLPPASVRVVWTSSIVVDFQAPKDGLNIADLPRPSTDQQFNYTITKMGNWLLAGALADQVGSQGILSVTHNPGNIKTDLTRHFSWLVPFLAAPLLYHARFGAYTELWAGLSPELGIEHGGASIIPWGRLHPQPRAELLAATKRKDDGGTGVAAQFSDYCEQQTKAFR